jgi:hypothetical protein
MIALSVLTLIYFLPAVVASSRGHGTGGILILNFLLGWTLIGWFVLLLWALVSRPPCYCVPVSLPCYRPYYEWRRY